MRGGPPLGHVPCAGDGRGSGTCARQGLISQSRTCSCEAVACALLWARQEGPIPEFFRRVRECVLESASSRLRPQCAFESGHCDAAHDASSDASIDASSGFPPKRVTVARHLLLIQIFKNREDEMKGRVRLFATDPSPRNHWQYRVQNLFLTEAERNNWRTFVVQGAQPYVHNRGQMCKTWPLCSKLVDNLIKLPESLT